MNNIVISINSIIILLNIDQLSRSVVLDIHNDIEVQAIIQLQIDPQKYPIITLKILFLKSIFIII
jgi:hypothetical protein